MRVLAVVAALAGCLLGSCSAGFNVQTLHSSDDDKAAASRAYVACIRDATLRFDDGKSAVDVVVTQVAGQCDSSYAALKTTLSRDLGGEARQKFEVDMDADRLVGVRDIVMRHRTTGSFAAPDA